MWKIKNFWNQWDKFAVVAHIIGILCTLSFTIMVIWFVTGKIKPLIVKKAYDKKDKYFAEI